MTTAKRRDPTSHRRSPGLQGVPGLCSGAGVSNRGGARRPGPAMRLAPLCPEEVITDPTDESGVVFFLTEGRARVVNHSLLGSEVRLSDIEIGAYFGELSAFDQGPRTASVIAAQACHVAAMPREVFFTMISQNPRVLRPILSDLASMVRQTNQKVMEYHLL